MVETEASLFEISKTIVGFFFTKLIAFLTRSLKLPDTTPSIMMPSLANRAMMQPSYCRFAGYLASISSKSHSEQTQSHFIFQKHVDVFVVAVTDPCSVQAKLFQWVGVGSLLAVRILLQPCHHRSLELHQSLNRIDRDQTVDDVLWSVKRQASVSRESGRRKYGKEFSEASVIGAHRQECFVILVKERCVDQIEDVRLIPVRMEHRDSGRFDGDVAFTFDFEFIWNRTTLLGFRNRFGQF